MGRNLIRDNTFQTDRRECTKREIHYFLYFSYIIQGRLKTYSGIELIRRFKIFLESAVSYLDKVVNITMFIQSGIQKQFRISGKKHFLYKTQKRLNYSTLTKS